MNNKKINTVDEYISTFPTKIQIILEKVRQTIKKGVPEAKEIISYRMPAYRIGEGRPIVYFAAFKKHIGLYPLPSAIESFKSELSKYKYAKGSIQFPLDQPIPYDLITKIIKFRVKKKGGRNEKI